MERGQGKSAKRQLVVDLVRQGREAYNSANQRKLPRIGELGLTSAVGGDMYGSRTINPLA
jgi:hypothetical protein